MQNDTSQGQHPSTYVNNAPPLGAVVLQMWFDPQTPCKASFFASCVGALKDAAWFERKESVGAWTSGRYLAAHPLAVRGPYPCAAQTTRKKSFQVPMRVYRDLFYPRELGSPNIIAHDGYGGHMYVTHLGGSNQPFLTLPKFPNGWKTIWVMGDLIHSRTVIKFDCVLAKLFRRTVSLGKTDPARASLERQTRAKLIGEFVNATHRLSHVGPLLYLRRQCPPGSHHRDLAEAKLQE